MELLDIWSAGGSPAPNPNSRYNILRLLAESLSVGMPLCTAAFQAAQIRNTASRCSRLLAESPPSACRYVPLPSRRHRIRNRASRCSRLLAELFSVGMQLCTAAFQAAPDPQYSVEVFPTVSEKTYSPPAVRNDVLLIDRPSGG
jgi:hypothetical protein